MVVFEQAARRRRLLQAGAVGVAASLALSDLLLDEVSRFWAGHAMVAGLVAFGATLALTVAVVDEVRLRRETSRWSLIGNLAMRRLSSAALGACGGLIQAFGFDEYADEIVAAQERFRATGERPGYEAPTLLPDGFEDVLANLLESDADREALADHVYVLALSLDEAIERWAPVMLRAPELQDALVVFGFMRESLNWFMSSLLSFHESGQARLNVWSNLRIFLGLFGTFDALRREALGESALFGRAMADHDIVWGMPFRAQESALRAATGRG